MLPVICLDPGHGGEDPGTEHNGITEKDLNLSVALRLRSLLLACDRDWPVHMTRDCDMLITLRERAEVAKECGANFVLSIHTNAGPNASMRGARGFYWPNNHDTRRICMGTTSAMPLSLRYRDEPMVVRKDDWTRRAYNVVSSFSASCALIEMGFATNARDAAVMLSKNGQIQMASALLQGVMEVLRS